MIKFIVLDVFLFLVFVACVATFISIWKSIRSEGDEKNEQKHK